MKNIFITLILLLFSNITVSQNTIDEKVTGNRIVKRIVKSNSKPRPLGYIQRSIALVQKHPDRSDMFNGRLRGFAIRARKVYNLQDTTHLKSKNYNPKSCSFFIKFNKKYSIA